MVTADSQAGPQAWVDAYHNTHQSPQVDSLPLKSGALQGAVVLDYPFDDHRFESIHILYDGMNGQLPNLDLLNTVVSIAGGQMGIGVALQQMWKHSDTYKHRLQTMLRSMRTQGLGRGTGPHSSFMPYHVDAITLQPFGHGWQDEMAMGRVIESTFRSLNNLLEHLHQSFFFYLLLQPGRFVSIGTYLPSAMLIAANFTIMAVFYWIKSGWISEERSSDDPKAQRGGAALTLVEKNGIKALVSASMLENNERQLSLPIAVVAITQFLGLGPLYLFNHLHSAASVSIRQAYEMLTFPVSLPMLHHPRRHYCRCTSTYLLWTRITVCTNETTVSIDQVLFLTSAGYVFVIPGNPQLFASFLGGASRNTSHIHTTTIKQHNRPVCDSTSAFANLTTRDHCHGCVSVQS